MHKTTTETPTGDAAATVAALLASANGTAVALPALAGQPLMPRLAAKTVCELDGAHRIVFEQHVGDGLLQFTDTRTGGNFRTRCLSTGAYVMPDVEWLEGVIREGRIRVVGDVDGVIPPERAERPEHDYETIVARDPRARLRRFVVLKLLEGGAKCSDPSIGEHLDAIWTPEVQEKWGDRPLACTARRWFRKVLGAETVSLIEMMDMTGLTARSPSPLKLDPAMRQFVQDGARWFYTNRGYRIRDVESRVDKLRLEENTRRVASGGFEPPLDKVSRSTISRAVQNIRCRDTLTEKFGRKWVEVHFKGSGEGLHTVRLLQIGLMDDKKIDGVFIIDGARSAPIGRPWLCLVIDVHTRCILGWHVTFQAPSVHSAAVTFKRACTPKRIRPDRLARWPVLRSIFGLLDELCTDNGSNYVSPAWEDGLLDCGTTLRLVAVGTPTHKAIIERLFYTFMTFLTAKLPGATLSPEAMREMGLDPLKEAVLTLSELEDLIEEFVHVYHVTNHSTLGMPPARAWELSAAAHGINWLERPERIDRFVGETYKRRLTKNGFQIEGHWFRDRAIVGRLADDLAGLASPKDKVKGTFAAWVKVKLNPEDMSVAYVWNDRTKEYVAVPSATPRYSEGLTMFQHRQIRAWARKQGLAFATESEQLAARQALNDLVLKMVPDVALRERRALIRMLGSESVRRFQGLADVVEAEPRHDGMGPIIDVEAGADFREDGGALTGRPAPGPVGEDAESPLDTTLERSVALAEDDPYAGWDEDDADGPFGREVLA